MAEAVRLRLPAQARLTLSAIRASRRAWLRAIGQLPSHARTSPPDCARELIQQGRDQYWATIVEAQRLTAAAWLARAERNDSAAVRLANEAADLEETVEKHPVTPGPLLPARELQGDLLFELERFGGALWSYAKTLEREPRRARALFGAARSAERSGDVAQARRYYALVADLMKEADSTRQELETAKAFLASGSEALRDDHPFVTSRRSTAFRAAPASGVGSPPIISRPVHRSPKRARSRRSMACDSPSPTAANLHVLRLFCQW